MLHKVLPDVVFQFIFFICGQGKVYILRLLNGSCETGSLHTKITDFFPLLSHSALYFRCFVCYLHTSKLNYNEKANITID